jgi:hypothetical protein
MLVREAGNVTDVRAEMPEKAEAPMVVRPVQADKSAVVMPVPAKTELPMLCKEAGNVTDVRLAALAKAEAPMPVMPVQADKSAEVIAVLPENALAAIEVMDASGARGPEKSAVPKRIAPSLTISVPPARN